VQIVSDEVRMHRQAVALCSRPEISERSNHR